MKHQVIKDDNRDMKYDNHMNEDNHSMNKENRI